MPAEEKPAGKAIEANLTESEQDVFNTVTLAELYRKQGHTDLARQVCKSILDKDPGNNRVRLFLDKLLVETGSNR